MSLFYLSDDFVTMHKVPDNVLEQMWNRQEQAYPTNDHAYKGLFNLLQQSGDTYCKSCGSADVEYYADRHAKCRSCGKTSSFTSQTFLRNISTPKAVLFTLELFQNGIIHCANQIHRITGVSSHSAWTFRKNLEMNLAKEQAEEAAETQEIEEVPSAVFCMVVRKRSTETPARKHPRAEETALAEEATEPVIDWGLASVSDEPATNNANENSRTNDDGALSDAVQSTDTAAESTDAAGESSDLPPLSPIEAAIYDVLSTVPINVDQITQRLSEKHSLQASLGIGRVLSGLTLLQVYGLVVNSLGGRFARVDRADGDMNVTDSQLNAAAAAEVFVHANHSGMSRKYSQPFISAYTFFATKKYLVPLYIIRTCLKHGPLTFQEIRAYRSPLRIKIAVRRPPSIDLAAA